MADKSISYVHGGPAFPIVFRDETVPGVTSQEIHTGMSLRDWFAGQILAGMVSYGNMWVALTDQGKAEGRSVPDGFAKGAYELADAMLRERAK